MNAAYPKDVALSTMPPDVLLSLPPLPKGKDVEFRRVATVLEPDADLEGLTPGGRYKVRVVAANSAGESAPSSIVDVTAPSLANVA